MCLYSGSLGLGLDPLESPGGHQADHQKVLASEGGGGLPGISLSIGALEGDVVERAFVGVLPPDARAEVTVTDFVHGLVGGGWVVGVGFHCSWLGTSSKELQLGFMGCDHT